MTLCVSRLILIKTKIFPLWDDPKCQIQAALKQCLRSWNLEPKKLNLEEKAKSYNFGLALL